ncbi:MULTISPECIES: DUF3284 domain-containing protein [unclassified Clostridioides]|uniref:DUF3284 domain-containing protein n=1 Tax=unclassified Clostridioides TaxID=2635829 RepID=UPI0006BC0762|nr:hypothetical protein KW95_12965 [Clostridioides difficile]MCC0691400.1 DUF3284 domain-containing protein [Clostridioides sp. ZZV14-6387]MCI9974763.1 DUF3284 domain-containing protein [Clostridioides difficile]MDB3083384.1 DUF3284 domain-containing protein [Clostridioides difficile]MDI0265080.1 DUF3284 domain-containing protein [Clostridioides difficile]
MNTFKAEILLKHSAKDIFNIFTKSARLNFPNFNEKKAVGTFVQQKNNKRFKVEITNFEKNKIYEIKTSNNRESIITRYELIHIDLKNTKLIFTESESERNVFGKINSVLVRILFGKRHPEEFNKFIKNLEIELENKNN